MSFVSGKRPNLIVWPSKSHHVESILKLANSSNFSVIPVSSSSRYRHHGDTIPKKNNCIILNLSKMNRIENLSILFSASDHKTLEFSLLKFVEELLRTKQIRFFNGKYSNNI